MVELNKRPMSPSQFAEEIGGASVPNVAQHFAVLENLGCIELVEVRTAKGRRRGASEHRYRAVQRVLFDASSWASIPRQMRSGASGAAFSTYIERFEQAISAGTLDRRSDRHLTWTRMYYDERSWREMIAAIDALFWRSLELKVEAELRMVDSQEEPIPVTTGMACFESPMPNGVGIAFPPINHKKVGAETATKSLIVSPRLAKALAHPLRIRIMVELNKRPMSASQFAEEVGVSGQIAAKHFKVLENLGCIELVGLVGQGQRGRPAQLYRATQHSLFDESNWELLPESLKRAVTGITITTYIEHVAEALVEGTLDDRDDRHFTWTAMRYDAQAWREMISATDALFNYSFTLWKEAEKRLAKSGEKPIPVTIGMACFESPTSSELTPGSVLAGFLSQKEGPSWSSLQSVIRSSLGEEGSNLAP